MMLRRNQAGQRVFFALVDVNTGGALTGATVTARRGLDAAAQAAATGTITELGNGQYRFDPSAADTDADYVGYLFTATGAIPVGANFVTRADAYGTADSGSTTTMVDAARTEADTDYWKGDAIRFTSGTLMGQTRLITGFVPGTDTITFAPATTVAVGTHNYEIIANSRTDIGQWLGVTPNALISGRVDANAQVVGDKTGYSLTAADIDQIVDEVWDEALAGHVAAGTTGFAQNAIDDILADTDDIQTRLPASLVGGRMRSHVEAMDAGVITAAVIATDAIDADAIAASAVTEIQAGLATAAALALVQADTDDIQTRLPATLNGGRMRSHVEAMDAGVITAAVIATGAIDADALATDAVDEIVDAVWNELQNGHTTVGTFGQRLQSLFSGTATAGAASTITLPAGASAIDSFYNNALLFISGGTGVGQSRTITTYVGATRVATVSPAWVTVPDATSVVAIVPQGAASATLSAADIDQIVDEVWDEALAGHVAAGTTGEAQNTIDDILADTNDIQTRLPATLNGGRMRSHVEAQDAAIANANADQVWDEILAGHLLLGSTGEALNGAGGGSSPGAVADAVWQEPKADHQGDTIMGNIAQDTDDLAFTGNEG
jgi:hypothetical protein